MSTVYRRPQARNDLVEIASYFGMSVPALAESFLAAAAETLTHLAKLPETGRRTGFTTPDQQAIGFRSIKGFPSHLLFFVTGDSGIVVLRVLHTDGNIESILRDHGAANERFS